MVSGGRVLDLILVILASAAAVAAARVAFAPKRSLPRQPAPSRPVLFVNPRSGGGRAAQVGLEAEASKRGIETWS